QLAGVLAPQRRKAKITEADLYGALLEIRLALLEADVNSRVVKEFVARVKERALGSDLLTGLNPGQQVVKIVHDELITTLGGERRQLDPAGRPSVLMLVGLQGSGKTTTAAKLGVRLRKDGKRPLLVAADVYRPAAVDQLVQLGDQIGVEVHSRPVGTPALEVARSGLEAARQRSKDVVILDTAGRLHVDDAMMDELVRIAGPVTPTEAVRVAQRMMEARFSLEDFKAQLQQIKKMGPIGQLVGMIPGAGQIAGAAQTAVDNGELRRIEAIIDSMTAEELHHPELIKASRRR